MMDEVKTEGWAYKKVNELTYGKRDANGRYGGKILCGEKAGKRYKYTLSMV